MTAINTNIGAIQAQSNMGRVSEEYNQAMTRLSSGKRINAAKDDAAGMAIGEKMTAQIKGLNQAVRNATDAKSLVDTTEGAHVEVSNMLQRMRELSVQSANDTNTDADRNNINAEAQQLVAEINRVAETTTFNGMNILDGSFKGKQFQIGADSGQTLNVNVDSAAANDIGAYTFKTDVQITGAGTTDSGITGTPQYTVSGSKGSQTFGVAAGTSARDFAQTVNDSSATTGVEATATTKARLTLDVADTISFTLGNATGTDEQVSIRDVNVATTSDLRGVRDAVNAVSGSTGITATMGNTNAEVILTDQDGDDIGIESFNNNGGSATMTVETLQADGSVKAEGSATTAVANGDSVYVTGQVEMTSTESFEVSADDNTTVTSFVESNEFASKSSVASIDLTTAQGATDAIKVLDAALQKISEARSDLGAVSNRLDSTISNLTNISTNVEAARSGIMDADFAKESTDLARGQILQQAATSMLAQANSSQQNVLSLIR
ncbi:flagellar filament protein [Rhodosalinus sediminis]|uniref:Flagellin n=1 Tax=Rhodosalinus sediminis TaxID=1940533 RepID=A0A3D9BXV9_9RHOB|nr:flagellin [Rhodosalinus sediminis]REC58373.1 flagellar filament protein [Rhodosalinus sediminis]